MVPELSPWPGRAMRPENLVEAESLTELRSEIHSETGAAALVADCFEG